jgi:1-acyl-sn-glycerol-3-phosphate acyltransferase
MNGVWQAGRTFGFIVGAGITALVASSLTWITHPLDTGDRMFAWILRWLSRSWLGMAGAEVEIVSDVPLDQLFSRPVLLAGNHQSTLDIPLLGQATAGRIRFFAKRSLFHIPIFGWAMGLKGFAPVDRRSARRTRPALDAAVARMRAGIATFVVFPEGTRSRDGAMLPYHHGTFSLARRAGIPVVPFALDGTGAVMPKGAWGTTPGRVRLRLGPPIEPATMDGLSVDDLMIRARTFTEEALAGLRRVT